VPKLCFAHAAGYGAPLSKQLLRSAACLLFLLPATATASAREVRVLMGTTAEVAVAGAADDRGALEGAFAALVRVDDALSLWKESALVRLNRDGHASGPAELLAVVRAALDVAAASGGAFDPTVEPLLRAAGDYGGRPRTLGDDERTALLQRVGYGRVRITDSGIRMQPGTGIDLGGIAKGYAVDLALASLREAGASQALVDLGGSSVGGFGDPLLVDVRDPEGRAPLASFVVRDAATSTSGADQKPDHILDPRTGRPAAGVVEATVVAATAMEADALSTAVFVLGPEAGLRLLRDRGAEGLVATREGDALVLRTTPEFVTRHALVARADVKLNP
jgi:thiamine biosynthesis lipoprotein